ncbi:MAG: peptide chain release factor N(5)-glutamine methyltransferase [Oscillospiraceae bacterium]|nr:peptide chain release factor N(5)-glutamine methyltransferase [Oscillospiraceae bacterium]
MAATYNDLYLDVRKALRASGVEAAQLEAREIVCFASGKTREEFLRDARLYASDEIVAKVQKLLERRLAGEPVAYLIGEWEFLGIPLTINEKVLIPRADTEVLALAAIEWLKQRENPRVLDLCCGSGCIGVAIAANVGNARVTLCDISEDALKIARVNVRQNGLMRQCAVFAADALASPERSMGTIDCIVCNPPYIPSGDIAGLDASVRDYEPVSALDGGSDGLDFYRSVTEKWCGCLDVGGRLCFEVGMGQADAVLRIMRGAGFGDIEIMPDTAGIPRVVCGTLCGEI